ncbi:MAG: cation diffusion facilitator family transporter [Candidatus Saccharibacteria bacterium]|nr:cation diffusion facilitator family transporter [Candidatus Saccharibacteria bacterium]
MNKRSRKIIRISIIGIITNLALAGFKIFVGLLSNSFAIILDAVNNLSDSLSSIVTIIGASFASKGPDRNHPMGHGRAEYLSTVIIGMLIIYMGFSALIEAIKKMITPEHVNYQLSTAIVVVVAIIVKIVLGIYYQKRGKKLDSDALIGSGIDALYDAIISIATLAAIITFFMTGWEIEPVLSTGISLFILRSGAKLIYESFNTILGRRADSGLTMHIKEDIAEVEGVNGAFDLTMHDYGKGYIAASVNIEVDRRLVAAEIDDISRKIQKIIYKKYHITLNSIGIYAVDLRDPTIDRLWHTIGDVAKKYEHIKEIHGFRVDQDECEISFDVVIDFVPKNRRSYYQKFCREAQKAVPGYIIEARLDSDVSD